MKVFLCNLAWLLSCIPGWLRFAVDLRFPRAAQKRRLRALLRANRDTAWGRRHGFASIRGQSDWSRVPPSRYEDYREEIARAAAGEPGRLTAAPLLALEPTSGSGGATKLIPYTAALRFEFQAAIDPWIARLYFARPRLLFGKHYWSVSPSTPCPPPEGCSVPVGFPADADYLGPLQRRLAACLFPVPSRIAAVRNQEAWLFLTLLFLVREREMRLISIWHPSLLEVFAEGFRRERLRLGAAVRSGRLPGGLRLPDDINTWLEGRLSPDEDRARLIEQATGDGVAGLAALWPNLQVISCWDRGRAAAAAAALRSALPGVMVEGKGLLATEGVVTIPWTGGAHVAALSSHVLEFEEVANGRALALADLAEGATYGVLLTTGGGLYRYRLGDLVRCTGFCARTPTLEFVSRQGGCCDLVGEKLTPEMAERTLRRLEEPGPLTFALIAPEPDGHGYTLFVEDPFARSTQTLGTLLEAALCESYHYAHARRLGQLRPVRVRPVTNGMARYRAELLRRGIKTGDLKAAPLDAVNSWEGVFGAGVEAAP